MRPREKREEGRKRVTLQVEKISIYYYFLACKEVSIFLGSFPFALRDSEIVLCIKITKHSHKLRTCALMLFLCIVCELQIADCFPEMESSAFILSSLQLYHFIHHPTMRAFQVVQK